MQILLSCILSKLSHHNHATFLPVKSVAANRFLTVFPVFIFCTRKLLDDLLPTARSSPHNQKNVRTNSPETKSNKKGLEALNAKGKNLCNLTTAGKPTNLLGQYMYATLTTWIRQKEPRLKS